MNKSKLMLAASLGFILTACAGNNTAKVGEKKVIADNSDRVCTKAATVGSHFKKKRCVSKRQAEIERLDTQELLRKGSALGSTLPRKN